MLTFQAGASDRTPFVPYKLVNASGVALSFWRVGEDGTRSHAAVVAPDAELVWQFYVSSIKLQVDI
jgi:hypothetical protein